jgi:hypothetical protein
MNTFWIVFQIGLAILACLLIGLSLIAGLVTFIAYVQVKTEQKMEKATNGKDKRN